MNLIPTDRKPLNPIVKPCAIGAVVAALLISAVLVSNGPPLAAAADRSRALSTTSTAGPKPQFNVSDLSYNMDAAGRRFHQVQTNPCTPTATGAVPQYLTFMFANPESASFAANGNAAYGSHDDRGTAHLDNWFDPSRLPEGSSLFWNIPYTREIGLVVMNHRGATAYYDAFPDGLNFSNTQSPWFVQVCFR